jgi:hypothetical protein
MLKSSSKLVSASQLITPISFAGDVTLSTGNLVIGTSGKGIDFSATSHPASMTSELLDDYEEGTWTPNLAFGGLNTGITYAGRSGWYVKIGNTVIANAEVFLSNKGAQVGDATISGLPFTPSGANGSAWVPFGARQRITLAASSNAFVIVSTTTTASLFQLNNLGGAAVTVTDTAFVNNSEFNIQIVYQV